MGRGVGEFEQNIGMTLSILTLFQFCILVAVLSRHNVHEPLFAPATIYVQIVDNDVQLKRIDATMLLDCQCVRRLRNAVDCERCNCDDYGWEGAH